MSITSPAAPLTPGGTAVLMPPATVQQLAAVAVQNLSPYYCAVGIGSNQYSLPPYTADMFATSSAGSYVALTVSNPDNAAGVSANAVATWFDHSEVPASGYPASLSPPALSTGLAVAQQLLAGGVPNVLTSKDLGSFNLGAGAAVLAVAGYASVSIVTSGALQTYIYSFKDVAGNIIYSDNFTGRALTVPVLGPTLTIGQFINPVTVRVTATNRQVAGAVGPGLGTAEPALVQTGTQAMVAGTTYPCALASGTAQPSGMCFAYFDISGAANKGAFNVVSQGGSGPLFIAHSGEMVATPYSTIASSKLLVLPLSEYTINFLAETTATFNARVGIQAVPLWS